MATFRNLLSNPSFEKTAGTVEVRRNLMLNARGTSNAGLSGFVLSPQWYGSGGSGATTYITGALDGPEVAPGVKVDSYGRKTWATVGTGAALIGWQFVTATRAPVTAGAVLTISAYWRKSFSGGVSDNKINVEFWDAASGGTKVGLTLSGDLFPEPSPGAWQRVWGTFTVPAGATHINPYHRVDASVANLSTGTTLDTTAAAVELAPALDGYLDHLISPDPDLTPASTGTPNASPSVLRGAIVTDVTAMATEQGVQYATSDTPAAGTKALRARILISGPVGLPVANMLPTPGEVHTLVLRVRARTRPVTVTPRIRSVNGAPVTLAVGQWTEVRMTAVAGSGAVNQTGLLLASTAGHQPGDLVDIDDAAVVPGVYTGPPFNGDTPDLAPWRQWWAGVPHESTSYRSEMTITATAQPSSGSVRIELAGGEPGTPLYVLRRGSGAGTGLVRETSEGTIVWPALGQTVTLTDYEATQGTSTMYIVTDADGSPITSTIVQVPLWGTWLKSPGRPFRNTRVRYVTDTGVKLAARRLVVDIEGAAQRVVFAQNRANPSATVSLVTLTEAEGDALRLLLSDGMTVLLDTPPSWGVPFRYVSVGDVQPDRAYDFAGLNLTAAARAWTLSDVIEVEPPQGVPVGDPGRTYADLPALFSSYVAIPATTETYERLGTGEA